MQHQLLKYKGIYRILPELDVLTHDIPKDKHGCIAKGYIIHRLTKSFLSSVLQETIEKKR